MSGCNWIRGSINTEYFDGPSTAAPASGSTTTSLYWPRSQKQKLVASDQKDNSSFGSGVAISSDGTTAVIGAYADDANGGAGAYRGVV